MLKRFTIQWLFCPVALGCVLISCGGGKKSVSESAADAESVPEIQAVADSLLGSGSKVVAHGDLAQNGREQALVIDPITTKAKNEASALLLTRAAVLERDGANWREVLRCDEYLKNTKGFLGGTPISPVTGWRLEVVIDKKKDDTLPTLYFTPLRTQGSARPSPVTVRWNPKLNRYQSFDRSSEQFLAELAVLETPASRLR